MWYGVGRRRAKRVFLRNFRGSIHMADNSLPSTSLTNTEAKGVLDQLAVKEKMSSTRNLLEPSTSLEAASIDPERLLRAERQV